MIFARKATIYSGIRTHIRNICVKNNTFTETKVKNVGKMRNSPHSFAIIRPTLIKARHTERITILKKNPLSHFRNLCRSLLLLPLLALVACDPSPNTATAISAETPASYSRKVSNQPFSVLTVAFCADPANWFLTGVGSFSGFEYDLLNAFSEEVQMTMRPNAAADNDDLLYKINHAQTSISAGLYRPAEVLDSKKLVWTNSFYATEALLVYNTDVRRPRNFAQIDGDTVIYLKNPGMEALVEEFAEQYPNVFWQGIAAPSEDAILELIDSGVYSYALVGEHQADLAHNIYFNFAEAFSTQHQVEMAWALPANKAYLRDVLNDYIARAKESGLINDLAERYFHHPRQVNRNDAGAFQARIRDDLPEFKDLFLRAQEASSVEWRLLAAVAYQESRWDPLARSETGVRGFMQITLDTAKHLGLDAADRFDAERSIHAAAVYLQQLKNRLPTEIAEPDRTWLTLAAYNIGLGHVEDAQRIARQKGLNPYLWKDVRKTLPLLAQSEYYQSARYGYARGGMPVAYVDHVRAYYDILLRQEPQHEHFQLHAKNEEIMPKV